jgi:hypothetical protein
LSNITNVFSLAELQSAINRFKNWGREDMLSAFKGSAVVMGQAILIDGTQIIEYRLRNFYFSGQGNGLVAVFKGTFQQRLTESGMSQANRMIYVSWDGKTFKGFIKD